MKLPVLVSMFLIAALAASAGTISGSIWEGVTGNAIAANIPGTPADVTFTVPNGAIDFNSNGSADYTIGSFLATNPAGATVLTGAGKAGDSLDNTIFLITGLVTVNNGDTFTFAH